MTISATALVGDIKNGRRIGGPEAAALWEADYLELLAGANELRRHFKGDAVRLCSIINAKSGRCSENCAFCAQSGHHETAVESYPFVETSRIEAAADGAAAAGACCFSVVTSGRKLTDTDIDELCRAVPALSKKGFTVSASLGELTAGDFRKLKAAGVRKFHHNLETAESFFPEICSTHRYADRVSTVRWAKEAGLKVCCGGILGLGETRAQRVELALALAALDADSVPVNFLNPVPGTRLADTPRLAPREALRSVALFRFILPEKDISVCGGREVVLGDLQSWIFFAGASGMMIGGYLTTNQRPVEQDLRMIKDLGLRAAGAEG